jgi:fluoride exporter
VIVLVGSLAGSMGAVTRFLVSRAVHQRTGSSLPVGTATVNLVGAFLIGLVVGSPLDLTWTALAAGFLGGFTTFSTWMIETVELGVVPRVTVRAAANLGLLTAAGLVCVALGYLVAG